jgi:predicted chitinase
MLATAFHETAKTMQPVRETMAASDDEAIAILDLAWRKGRLNQVREPYWRRDASGKSWLGRGLVQLTHRANYAKLSGPVGVDLVTHPEMAMEVGTAVKIMFAGMEKGLFTGKRLADFFNPLREDWTGARQIVNGTDRAVTIASHAKRFHAALGPVEVRQAAC